MEKFFELLEKYKLIKDEQIEHTIMRRWTKSRVYDFRDTLSEVINTCILPQENLDLSNYSFIPNSDMTAQPGSCPTWSCRLRRIDELARFSVLYADSVYIQNYFEYFYHKPSNDYEEYRFRYRLAGDLKIMNKLRPLLTSGIFRVIQPPEPGFHICADCASKVIPTFKHFDKNIKSRIRSLSKIYSPHTSATLFLDEHFPKVPVYDFEVKGPEDLWHEGGAIYILEQSSLPRWFIQKTRHFSPDLLSKGVLLSEDEILKLGLIDNTLGFIARDIWIQHFLCRVSRLNLKYLTDRNIDVSLLDAMTDNEQFKAYNRSIQDNLIYELPVLLNVPLDSLLDVRKSEYDAFLVFRDSIDKVIGEYVLQHKDLSTTDATEIYLDIIKPRLNQLNNKVKSIRNSRWKKARRDIYITTGLLSFGVCSMFLWPGVETIPLSLGGIEAVKSLKSVSDSLRTPEEIRNDNFYFLWKLTKKLR